jgi:hypothetical protein
MTERSVYAHPSSSKQITFLDGNTFDKARMLEPTKRVLHTIHQIQGVVSNRNQMCSGAIQFKKCYNPSIINQDSPLESTAMNTLDNTDYILVDVTEIHPILDSQWLQNKENTDNTSNSWFRYILADGQNELPFLNETGSVLFSSSYLIQNLPHPHGETNGLVHKYHFSHITCPSTSHGLIPLQALFFVYRVVDLRKPLRLLGKRVMHEMKSWDKTG